MSNETAYTHHERGSTHMFQAHHWYRAVWRWHFYVGLLVMPFLFLLCVTGLLMLASKPIDTWLERQLTTIESEGERLPASVLLGNVRAHYPQAEVQVYIPSAAATESARFSLAHPQHAGRARSSTMVYVNPYNGEILGDRDPAVFLYDQIKTAHSTLLLGYPGNLLIEGAAGLAILMVLSGLYLSWSSGKRNRSTANKRRRWRRWHTLNGWVVALPLLFFLLSGLAWTSIWGGHLVQPWGSLPGTQFDTPLAEYTHETLNHDGPRQVPWALEQTAMPAPRNPSTDLTLDDVIHIAHQQGFGPYRVHLPLDAGGVWTLSATTMAGDVRNPLAERILHLDPTDGKPLAEIAYADYPLMGMAMAAFIPLHQGNLGLWNLLANMMVIMLVLFLMASGIILWSKRRNPKARGLQAPPSDPFTSKVVLGITLAISLCFPVSAAILAVVIVVDLIALAPVRRILRRKA